MNALKPFFLLIQRPLVLFGAIGWMIIATFLISALVRQGGDPEMYMDASFLTVVILSAFAGWLIGSCILELHQTSFAVVLPTARTGLLPGFLLFAVCVVFAAVLPTASASPAPQNSWLLFVMGLGAYATGASIRDPQSGLLTGLGTALLLVLLVTSGVQASLAIERPLLVVLLAGGLFALGLFRLFGQDQLRSRSLNRGRPVLMFSAEKLGQAQQKREMAYGPTKSRWRQGYLGIKTGNWLKAAWHESYGGHKNRTLLKTIGASWGLVLILLVEARETFDELGAWKSICWVIHDGLMRSPYPPLTGEHSGAFIMVSMLIIIAGASIALWRPVALAEAMLYPLSRRQKADLFFCRQFPGYGDTFVCRCASHVCAGPSHWNFRGCTAPFRLPAIFYARDAGNPGHDAPGLLGKVTAQVGRLAAGFVFHGWRKLRYGDFFRRRYSPGFSF